MVRRYDAGAVDKTAADLRAVALACRISSRTFETL